MAYTVIRTDLPSAEVQLADLVSLRFYDSNDNVAEVENGTIVELQGYEGDATNGYQREVMKAVAATADSDLNSCAIVAGVDLHYDERKKRLDQFINEAGRATRGYIPRSRNMYSVTAEGFVGGTAPDIGDEVGIGTGGKIDASGSGLGKCVAIETAGAYTFYTIEIGKTEVAGD